MSQPVERWRSKSDVSGLAAALQKSTLPARKALLGALFSVCGKYNLSGSLLAGYWSGKPIKLKIGRNGSVY